MQQKQRSGKADNIIDYRLFWVLIWFYIVIPVHAVCPGTDEQTDPSSTSVMLYQND